MDFSKLIPDLIDEAPAKGLSVEYETKKVNYGNEIKPSEVRQEPKVTWEADPTKFYTLAMVDPDIPDKTLCDAKHWLVVNIQGNNVSSGQVIAEYLGSGAPKGTGLHRYVFLVFEQSGKLQFDEPFTAHNEIKHRLSFCHKGLVKKYNLSKPIAGNYFVAQWEPLVDEYRKLFIDF